MKRYLIGAICTVWALGSASAFAQSQKKAAAKPASKPAAVQPAEEKDAATLEFEKFRAEMEENNPAELFEMKGEELWKEKRGPKQAALSETCDLGKGIGKVEGAYVIHPRYYADADAVMDIERRVVWCMTEKQGFSYDEIAKKPFANNSGTPDITSLVTYIAGQSRNQPFAVPLSDPKVREAWEIGKEIAHYRAGPYDFSCSTCHGSDGKRIRMQQLPNISTKEGALKGVQGWPGYRMTGGFMLTQQWRMNDCFRQQRFPQPKYASDTIAYLLTYMTANTNGSVYKGPGIKR